MRTKLDWKKNKNQLVVILLVGILLIVVAIPTKKPETEENTEKKSMQTTDIKTYGEIVETRLEKILKDVEGVGEVSVMVTFHTSSEKVIEKDREKNSQTVTENDRQGGSRETKEAQNREETVYDSSSDGKEIPYVTKEINPQVEGVIVIAQGGGNAVVRKNITEAIQALFDVDTHKIKVMKRNQTK